MVSKNGIDGQREKICNDNEPTNQGAIPLILTDKNEKKRKFQESKSRVVSISELTSLSALISYVAHRIGESETKVEKKLVDQFNISHLRMLPADQFDNALKFLVDGMMR